MKSGNELSWSEAKDPESFEHMNNWGHRGILLIMGLFQRRFSQGDSLIENPALEVCVCYLVNWEEEEEEAVEYATMCLSTAARSFKCRSVHLFVFFLFFFNVDDL